MKSNFEYYALVLNEESQKKLLAKTEHLIEPTWKIYAHHMTILHRSTPNQALEVWASNNIGRLFPMTVVRCGIDSNVLAVEVHTRAPSANTHKHITVATSPTGKPVQSNYIKEWNCIEEFELTGIVTKFQLTIRLVYSILRMHLF